MENNISSYKHAKKNSGDLIKSEEWNVLGTAVDQVYSADISLTGNKAFKGSLSVTENLGVKGNLDITGNITVSKDLNITGKLMLGDCSVYNDIQNGFVFGNDIDSLRINKDDLITMSSLQVTGAESINSADNGMIIDNEGKIWVFVNGHKISLHEYLTPAGAVHAFTGDISKMPVGWLIM